jgi:hypothetical protein
MQLVNSGVSYTNGGRVRYRVQGRRMSGDMNTSSGNVILMTAIAWAFMTRQQYHLRYVNNGDDCVFFMERGSLAKFQNAIHTWFLDFGFTAVCEPAVDMLEQVEFCQTKPIWTPQGYIMCRDPRKVTVKDVTSVSLMLNSPKVFARWKHAIGSCGVASHGGLPVLSAFYGCLLRNGRASNKPIDRTIKSTGLYHMSKGMSRKGLPVHPLTRASFYWAYGIDPLVQEALEEDYDSRVISDSPVCDSTSHAEYVSEPIYDGQGFK